MIACCLLRVRSITIRATLEARVGKVIRQALLYACFIEWEISRKVVYESRSLDTRFDELVRCGVASMNVLDLRVTQGGFSLVWELLAWCRIRTQEVASTGDWQAIPTSDPSVARCRA